MNITDIAIQIAAEVHAGQTDVSGEAAILHPLAVGLMGITDEERCTGFLHHTLYTLTPDELTERGIPEGTVEAVRLLTRPEGMSHDEHLNCIIDSRNPIAMKVTLYDLRHNAERLAGQPALMAEVEPALERIEEAVREIDTVVEYDPQPAIRAGHDIAVFAAGCFWGVQHYFERHKGVVSTLVGYTGGTEPHPTYDAVRHHTTGHVEAIMVEYDPEVTSYEELAKLFFEIHDPAQTDGQGTDIGPQYRSALFYADQHQEATAKRLIAWLRTHGHEVNSQEAPLLDFWVAEQWHQHYYDQTGGSPYCHFRVRKFGPLPTSPDGGGVQPQ